MNGKTKKTLISLIAALIVLAGGYFGYQGFAPDPAETQSTAGITSAEEAAPAQTQTAAEETAPAQTQVSPQTTAEPATAAQEIRYVFYNEKTMNEHFAKHAADTGCASVEEYLARANAVIENPDSLHKLEEEDGDDIYYLEATNEIVFVSQRGYIRTYFCPDRGIAYFNKQ